MIDSSALLAYFRRESGFEQVRDILRNQPLWMSAVNRTEVQGKLVGSGLFTAAQVLEHVTQLTSVLETVAFDVEQSDLAGFFYARRAPYRLSLGDCACLALAEIKGLPVLTAERAWSSLPDLPVPVQLIR